MEGQAEVATVDKETGKPLNGTLKYQLTDPRTAAEFAPLWDRAKSNWTVLPEIKVWYNEAGKTLGTNTSKIPGVAGVDYTAGPLSVGFGCACVSHPAAVSGSVSGRWGRGRHVVTDPDE